MGSLLQFKLHASPRQPSVSFPHPVYFGAHPLHSTHRPIRAHLISHPQILPYIPHLTRLFTSSFLSSSPTFNLPYLHTQTLTSVVHSLQNINALLQRASQTHQFYTQLHRFSKPQINQNAVLHCHPCRFGYRRLGRNRLHH